MTSVKVRIAVCGKCGGTGEIYTDSWGYPRPCYPCLVGELPIPEPVEVEGEVE